MKPINVKVGDTIQRVGGRLFSANTRPDGTRATLNDGDLGEVIAVHPPRKGFGSIIDTDGESIPDPDRDGYAVVTYPNWVKLSDETPRPVRILPEDENKSWRKVT